MRRKRLKKTENLFFMNVSQNLIMQPSKGLHNQVVKIVVPYCTLYNTCLCDTICDSFGALLRRVVCCCFLLWFCCGSVLPFCRLFVVCRGSVLGILLYCCCYG
jgi:hypothetical protein